MRAVLLPARTCAAVVLAAAVLLGLVALPATAAPATPVTATVNLNIRSGPSTSAAIVGGLEPGQTVTETGRTSGWSKIVFAGRSAWVATRYLARGSRVPLPPSRVAAGAARITSTALNLRVGAGPTYRVVTVLPEGTQVTATGRAARGYAEVSRGSTRGWASLRYLVRVAGAPVSSPAPPTLPRVTGTRYATTTLDVRSTYADRYTLIAEVPRGTALSITGVVRNGRMQIIYNRAARWVTAKYLSSTRSAGVPPSWQTVERGLQPNAVRMHRAARARFGSRITTYYGWRRDITPDHPAGRALDLMIPRYKTTAGRKLGAEAASWARTNARSLKIKYVIWDQKIWNIERDREGWRPMGSRGNDSANHKDHVHVTVYDG